MAVININGENDFNEKVLQADKPTLVDFWAPWCGPCKLVGPEVEAVADQHAGTAVVAKVNVDENQTLASRYNVMGVPTLLVIKNGQEVNRIVGYRPRAEISAALNGAK
ncbi:thioredoxin|uniref:Thioredoxin n=1 Tax=Dendrosporobacter quercicolus TaxID=146817 RepID=A0A1G9MNH2_9FIRM|nr:thioredoxin [Dendrosporobacter quercicolus]NSL47089.1 thioredoxin [Dendrosporobacter quercicolus DSM 1736]SDL75674.1 thioredoxin [Dendrosporobacter quercicolus]